MREYQYLGVIHSPIYIPNKHINSSVISPLAQLQEFVKTNYRTIEYDSALECKVGSSEKQNMNHQIKTTFYTWSKAFQDPNMSRRQHLFR